MNPIKYFKTLRQRKEQQRKDRQSVSFLIHLYAKQERLAKEMSLYEVEDFP